MEDKMGDKFFALIFALILLASTGLVVIGLAWLAKAVLS